MEKDFEYCVFIGRFQPIHNSHLAVVKQALQISEKLIIVIGSSKTARNIKNPFTYEHRLNMFIKALEADEETKHQTSRISFVPVRDYFYNDNAWVTELQQKITAEANYSESIALIGNYKDSSSYYLNLFPQWKFIPVDRNIEMMDATSVREKLFTNKINEIDNIPPAVYGCITFKPENYGLPDLQAEYEFIKKYKKQWEAAPYPPTFVTTDAVVIQSGHILVVKRKFHPGKGLYALPGGFIKADETIETAMLRELKEETGIKVPVQVLRSNIIETKVFDHPDRSLRGRTITHASCIQLNGGDLPEIKQGSDADSVMWMPLMDALSSEDKFYEDHGHIIRYFVSKY